MAPFAKRTHARSAGAPPLPLRRPADVQGWAVSPRGAGYLFGGDVVEQFNHANALEMICRAHQLVMEGYKSHFNGTAYTVWSAPNYCYRCGNVAAIMRVDEGMATDFVIFKDAPVASRGSNPTSTVPEYFL